MPGRPQLKALDGGEGYGDDMATTALEVRIRPGEERVSMTRFTHALDKIRLVLSEIDKIYLARGSHPQWMLRGLGERGSHMFVQVTASPARGRDPRSLLVPVDALVSGVETLTTSATVPAYYTEKIMDRLVEASEPKSGLQEVSVATVNGTVGEHAPISEPVREHARQALQGRHWSYGTVSGRIDRMSAPRKSRHQPYRVSIFDPLTRQAVSGYIPAELANDLGQLWTRRVLAGGWIARNERGQPLRIKVDRLERLPDDDSGRPDPQDMVGIAPDWLEGRDVDDYLREVRRA